VKSNLIRTFALLLGSIAIGACSSTPELPSTILNPHNSRIAAEGQRLVDDGQWIVDNAKLDIEQGEKLADEGRTRKKKGEEMMDRGRRAIQAAAISEEAEQRVRDADKLKGEILP
jgi:hypothetical protein